MTGVPRIGRLLLAVGVAALTVLAGPAPAQAHAYLASSAPADGAVLDRAPETLTLAFTEHVELAAARVGLVDGDGRHWAVTGLALRDADGAPAADDADSEEPVTLVAGLPALPPNTYHVSWRTLSSDDLHTTRGTLVFGVGRQVTAVGVAGPVGPGPRETVARAVGLLGLSVLIGGAALALLHAAGRRRADPGAVALRRRLLIVAGYAGIVALLAGPLLLAVQLAGAGDRWRLLAAQLTGGRWLLREAGTAALVVVALLAARRPADGPSPVVLSPDDPVGFLPPSTVDAPGVLPTAVDDPPGILPAVGLARAPGAPTTGGRMPATVVVGAIGAVAAASGTALLGHPMGGPGRTALVGGVHVLAAGGWAGSVLAAALALLPRLRHAPDRGPQVRALLRAFATLAVACLALLVVTGLLLTGPQVASVDALVGSPYGLLLMAKVAVAVGAVLLGARTARRLRRTDLPRRGLRVEAGLLAVALGLAGALAAAGPGRGPAFPQTAVAGAEPQVTGQMSDLVDTVALRPNRPGRNIVSVGVDDTRRPAPGPVTGVSLLLTGPNGERAVHPVTRTGDGWVVTVDDIHSPGRWRVGVTVLRDGLPPVTDTHPWTVPAGASTAGPVRVSAAPLRPVLDRAALLLAAVATGVVLGAGGRRWRARRPGSPPPGGRQATR
ncbi:copper resistance CopC family protein [Micromonospora mirobrigensis]|uniref:Copper transport protein n=1 Tax=Micromonospora mirobrigensis TaxID=262898 RepID=A0A1C4WET4_9ACTN|nr:copper resistance CopC family protein [Micromonospora mirobrigensis]SCE94680.1 copper transport protein [Micromonospora mirobrigensis]